MKIRKLIQIDDFLDALYESQPHELSGSFDDEDGEKKTITILNDEMFQAYTENMFYSYCFVMKDYDPEDLESKFIDKFNSLWKIFQIENRENIDKILNGYYWDYVPVYNFDRRELWEEIRTGNETDNTSHIIAKQKETNTTTGGYTDTYKPTGKVEDKNVPSGQIQDSTVYGQLQTTVNKATMDSSIYERGTQETTNQRTDTNTRSYLNSYNETNTRSYLDNYQEENKRVYNTQKDVKDIDAHTDQDNRTLTYNDVKDKHEGHLYGNIGVTTNVQMIKEELDLRIHNLGYEFLKRFFDKFAVML